MKKCGIVLVVGVIFCSLAGARQIYVPADFSTIQAGIDDANNGDVVIVSRGRYYENINFKGKNITVASTAPEDWSVVEATIIDGSRPVDPNRGSVVTFAGGETKDAVVKGFTITGGSGYWLKKAAWFGGGICCYGGAATISNMAWVSINDPGIEGHEGFNGQMSRYETTNAQYAQFLNEALATGDIIVDGNNIKGANSSNSGADFAGQVYYDLAGPGYPENGEGVTTGGAARINYSGCSFTVDSGFENHPVTYVSWYGAVSFCNYYGWRLPTEWEWHAVADYDGSYIYGCGMSIDNSIANYRESTHPYGTTVVGAFGTYGYGMADMAGNVLELTDSPYVSGYFVFRGGEWFNVGSDCSVFYYRGAPPSSTVWGMGFRVCH